MNRFLLAALFSAVASASAASPPRILFVIADDWGAHAGAYGTPWIRTPSFDRVAREGLLFRNAYTPMAKCAPSRAIVLTGRHLWQNGEAGNHLARFPADLKVWPEVLRAHGWTVGITGKGWGPGIASLPDGSPRELIGRSYGKRRTTPPTSAISANDYAANFADFLDAVPADTPWCFWCGFTEPHRGYEFGSGVAKGGKRLGDIDRIPGYWPDDETVRHDLLDYAFEVEHADAHLGRMLDALAQRGWLDSTLVVVTSDHGMPFPRAKGYAYPDANHVPLAVRWPAGIPRPGRVIEDFVDFTDLAPTFLDVAGIDPKASGMPPVAGSSWRPLFESDRGGQILPARDHVLLGKERTDVGRPGDQGYPIRGILTASHLYLHNHEPSRWPAGNPETGYPDSDGSPTKTLLLERGRRDRADPFWQWNFGLRPEEELYDLASDPDCLRNLAAAQPERASSLRQRLERELTDQGDPRMAGQGHLFDAFVPTTGAGFYERFRRGEVPPAGWITPSDVEPAPLEPRLTPGSGGTPPP
jgi:arylsulfatase A-like enzyme